MHRQHSAFKLSPPLLLLLSASIAGLHGPAAAAGEPLPIGAVLDPRALGLSMLDVGGGETSLGTLRGEGGLLVIFTANTCAYVTDWLDRFALAARQAADRGVGVAVVNSNARKRRTDDSEQAMRQLAAAHFPGVPYLLDEQSRLADLLGARRTPEVFLFDQDLKLVYHGQIDDHSGAIESARHHYLRDALGGLESGVFPPPTPPLGCSVLRPRRRSLEKDPG